MRSCKHHMLCHSRVTERNACCCHATTPAQVHALDVGRYTGLTRRSQSLLEQTNMLRNRAPVSLYTYVAGRSRAQPQSPARQRVSIYLQSAKARSCGHNGKLGKVQSSCTHNVVQVKSSPSGGCIASQCQRAGFEELEKPPTVSDRSLSNAERRCIALSKNLYSTMATKGKGAG